MVEMKKFVIFFIVSSFVNVQSHIVIDIDPSELQSIGEVLVESYFHHNLIQRQVSLPQTIFSKIVNFSFCVLKLIGVTASLIAANLFTPLFQSFSTTNNALNTITHVQYNKSTIVPSKICPNDFGCDRNVCWRTCDKGENEKHVSWCFTTSKPGSNKYAQCINSQDCSGCWECLGQCHSKID